ncbi:MAG: hypothetical protein JJT81_18755, partial [Rubellimicrobium sp.]|nr:hypothetical protein [Rubellimicrobium sp.]
DEDQLEVYREASAHDGRDPGPILAERGLGPIPGAPRPPALARGSRDGESVAVAAPDTPPQGAP